MKKLGIIGAMSVEIETLKEQMSGLSVKERAGMTFYEGKLENLPAVLVVCGVGKVNAAMCVQVLCDCFEVTHIVNTGVAGSLCAELDIGDFVISTMAMYHDFDCSSLNPDYPVGQVPGLPVRGFAANEALRESYGAAYGSVAALRREIDRMTMDEGEKLRRMETLRYQIEEISKAQLQPGEDDALEERRKLLQNAEKISDGVDTAVECLYGGDDTDGAASLLAQAERELARLDYRMAWEDALRAYITELDRKKPVIYCGDLNVAHQEIDIKNPKSNRRNPGFTDEEREKMTTLLDSGFTDTFRYLYPDKTGAYSWWSYRFNARKNNAGWRIDYFIVSDRLKENIKGADIWSEVLGSDHCPVVLDLDF